MSMVLKLRISKLDLQSFAAQAYLAFSRAQQLQTLK